MAANKSIVVPPSKVEVTIEEAAEILSFSKPYVVQLMEEGKIPFRKEGRAKRILLVDLLRYKRHLMRKRRDVILFLAREAQDMKLDYQ